MTTDVSDGDGGHAPSKAFLNLICPGMVQVLIGKKSLGMLFNAVNNLAYMACLFAGLQWSSNTQFSPFGWACIFTAFAMSALSTLDAWLSIKHIRSGKKLHAWQMFPVS